MNLRYHERLKIMRPPWPQTILNAVIFAVCWVALLIIDCILFLMGWRWANLRSESRLEWRK